MGSDQRLGGSPGGQRESMVHIGQAALGVAPIDQVVLAFQQTAVALLALAQLPDLVVQAFGDSLRSVKLGVGDQQATQHHQRDEHGEQQQHPEHGQCETGRAWQGVGLENAASQQRVADPLVQWSALDARWLSGDSDRSGLRKGSSPSCPNRSSCRAPCDRPAPPRDGCGRRGCRRRGPRASGRSSGRGDSRGP